MHRPIAGVVAAFLLLFPAVLAAQSASRPARPSASAPKYDRYQVAAGTALLLKLQTALDSGMIRVGDQVDAALWSPVVQDGVELIPAGSTVFGQVTAVEKATERKPLGTFAIAFSIVEHAETGDRATMNTRPLSFEAATPVPVAGKKMKLKPTDIMLAEGSSVVAVTSEPLVVRIPRGRQD
jgi:hypothetical protein